jgi:hypothetical protein
VVDDNATDPTKQKCQQETNDFGVVNGVFVFHDESLLSCIDGIIIAHIQKKVKSFVKRAKISQKI